MTYYKPPFDDDDRLSELYQQAVAHVKETGVVRIAGIQRKLKIAYWTAEMLVKEMARQGIVKRTGGGTYELA